MVARQVVWSEKELPRGRATDLALRRLQVKFTGREVPVWIGPRSREELPVLLGARRDLSHIHLVADSEVHKLHGPSLVRLLEATGKPVSVSMVPSGEASKCAGELFRLWQEMVRAGCNRDSCVVAFGGGVVGDLGGFAAASVFRGIDLVQVPTTLLAMVDASVGGKTAINLPEGKNLVGAFHQPLGVVMDLDYLATLPDRQWISGWAEVIKTAAIRSARLFEGLESRAAGLLGKEPDALAGVIEACCKIKADVVGEDEREAGLRRILNFGHTLAHGIETVAEYAGFLHGEAVAMGMSFAAELGEALGVTRRGAASRLEACLRSYGLPVKATGLRAKDLLEAMEFDKKRGPAGLRWVLLTEIGDTKTVDGVPAEVVRAQLERFLGG
jgi:3-dehydroquinate synthase